MLLRMVDTAWGLAKYVHKFAVSFLENDNQLEQNY